MNIKNNFMKKTVIYFIGNLSSRLLSTLLIPIYAFFVSPSDLGNYDYIIALMNILMPIVFFNMWDSVLKYVISNDNQQTKKKYFSSSFFFIIINIIIFIVIYTSVYYLKLITYPYYLLSIIMMISYGFVTFWQYACRALNENKIYAMSGVISSFINVVFIVLFVIVLKMELFGLIISYIISMIASIILMEAKICLRKQISLKYFNLFYVKKMAKFSYAIVLNTVSLWGISGISKIICVNFLNASANGIFSFANKLGSIITIFGSIIGAVIIEEAYLQKSIEDYRRKFSILIEKIFSIYLVISILGMPIINIVYHLFLKNNNYYSSIQLIPFILLSAIFASVATNYGSAFQVTEKTNYIFMTSAVGSIVSIVFSISSISVLGVLGVSISQMIGNTILLIFRANFAYKLTGLKVSIKRICLLILIFFAVSMICLLSGVLINIIIEIILLFFMCIIFKSELLDLYKSRKLRKV